MPTDETVGTKLWIEKHPRRIENAPNVVNAYHHKKITLSVSELNAINKYIKANKISADVLLHTVYAILLARLSTTDILVYGMSCYQNTPKNKELFCNGIAPIKVTISDDLLLSQLISKLSSQISKNKISAKLPPEIRYLLLNKNSEKKVSIKDTALDVYRFPLVLLTNKNTFKELSFAYNVAFFQADDIASLIYHFKVILKSLTTEQDLVVNKINILSPTEKNKLLNEWASPSYPFKMPDIKLCVQELVTHYAKQAPELLAINHHLRTLTYQDLDNSSTALAIEIIEKGVKVGDCVCVHMDRTALWLVTMIAIFKAGGIYVPINPKFPQERIEFVFSDCMPSIVLVDQIHEKIPSAYHKILHMVNIEDLLSPDTDLNRTLLPKASAEATAYILYTSGTTGTPKGVPICHKSLNNLIAWYQACFKVSIQDRSVQFASQGFDSHICEVIPFLGTGASVHIVDDSTKLTPSLFFEWLQENRITVCDIPTAYAQILFNMSWPNPISLRLMKIGGEAMTRYPEHPMPFEIWNGYGPTETTVEATYFKVTETAGNKKAGVELPPPAIGKPIYNYKVYIVDAHLQPVPVNIAGEILIGGVGVSKGYLNRESLTAEKFIVNPFNDDPNDKLYRTGDLGRWLKDGNIEFIGRKDNQIKLRGYRIELSDIENALSKYSDVSEAVVLIRDTVDNSKSIVGYIVPNLDKDRYLYQERCLLSLNKNKYMEAITEDISKDGIALNGISEKIPVGKQVKLHLKLPGINEAKDLTAKLIWQINNRCGFVFDCPDDQKKMIAKSIDYYLSTHNMMEMILSAAAKRSLKKALKNRLPEYMIPSTIIMMLEFPLTYSGKIDTKSLPPPQEYEKILHHEYIPPKTNTEKELVAIWHDLLGRDNISMSDNFFDLGGSSLTAAILSVKILNQFKITIPAKILFDLSYIPILAEYIDSNGEQYSKQSMIQEDIQRDCILPENISPTKKLIKTAENPQNILLTGAGGFLGIYLLRELLACTNAKIYCLIRKGEFDTAAKRLLATINKFNLGKDVSLNDRRIIAIASDLSADNFGLPVEQYNSLLEKIDLIYHCGAQVNIMASYNKLRGSNVIGTLEVIKFATTRFDKPIHYISTLSSAYQKDAEGALSEVFPEASYEELSGGYAISKWVAERLLTEAKDRGLPVQIYRSGYISGQSDTGQANFNDSLFMLIKGCIQLGYAPNMAEKVSILPVDYVGQATVALSLAHPLRSTVYHIDHPSGIMWPDLIDWINNYGYRVKLISIADWKKLLPTLPQDNALFSFLPYYLAFPDDFEMTPVNVAHATAELSRLDLPYPPIDDALLTIYFDFMCKDGFLSPPPTRKKITVRDR